jgi:hypothetical protein
VPTIRSQLMADGGGHGAKCALLTLRAALSVTATATHHQAIRIKPIDGSLSATEQEAEHILQKQI